MPTNTLERTNHTQAEDLATDNYDSTFPVDYEGHNQGAQNGVELVSTVSMTEAQPEPEAVVVAAPHVREFKDKYGNTRYMKQGVNAETGYKYTSFISKKEANKLMGIEEETDGLLEDLPEFVKRKVLVGDAAKTPLTDDVEEISGEHVVIKDEAQEVALTARDDDVWAELPERRYGKKVKDEAHRPEHMKQKVTRRARVAQYIGRKLTGRSATKAGIYLGLVDDPNRGPAIQAPNRREVTPNYVEEELTSTPISGEVTINAPRADETYDDKAA